MEKIPFILGNLHFHERLCLVTEVLSSFLTREPQSRTVDQIRERVLCERQSLINLCKSLESKEILVQDLTRPDAWYMSPSRQNASLWDIYEFVATEIIDAAASASQADTVNLRSERIECIWMQCALTANQQMAQYLQKFPLEQIARSVRASSARFNWSKPQFRATDVTEHRFSLRGTALSIYAAKSSHLNKT